VRGDLIRSRPLSRAAQNRVLNAGANAFEIREENAILAPASRDRTVSGALNLRVLLYCSATLRRAMLNPGAEVASPRPSGDSARRTNRTRVTERENQFPVFRFW
jgi:hypothetical protein